MQDFLSFIKDFIQDEDLAYSWLESRRYELSPLLSSRLKFLLDGRAFIVVTDDERVWFEEYFLGLINAKSARPLLPFFSLRGLKLSQYDSDEMLEDLLDLTFPNGYIFIYVGKDSGKMAKIAKNKIDSLLIIFDEKYDNSFCIESNDKNKDIKLITLAKLINACVSGLVFARIKV